MCYKGGEFSAHYREKDNKVQMVEEHLFLVSKYCRNHAGKLGFANLGKLIGILHDLGKFTDEFLKYFWESVENERERKPKPNYTVDHGKYGAMLILNKYHNGSQIRKLTAEIASMAICYHHGGMEDFLSNKLEIKLFIRCGRNNEEREKDSSYLIACNRFFDRVMKENELANLFNEAVLEVENYVVRKDKDAKTRFFNLHLITKFLYSCLIDADRYDTYLFMQDKKEEKELDMEVVWKKFSSSLKLKEEEFRNKIVEGDLANRIKNLRQEIWKQCNDFGYKREGIYTLTVPTGGGKTLSSLRYALNHAIEHNKKRIIYILPFTSIIEQNASVVREVLNASDYLLEHHSNVSDDTVYNNEIIEYRQLLTERWDVPIIFTTMVQFLNTFFSKGTKNIRRLHNLTDTILIFDEIQALPVKCISLFNSTINFLYYQCRDTIILCSATQPSLTNVEHKLCEGQEIIKDIKAKFEGFKRVEVIDTRYQNKMSLEEAGDFIARLSDENESILVVMNTKEMAVKIYEKVTKKLEGQDISFYFLSTHLCSAHRKKVIKEMKDKLNNHEPVICISTQLIEAGVDISFSCVVRHLAGMDSIAQAFGRGNRNGEGNIKNMYIIQIEDEKLGSLEYIKQGQHATAIVLDKYRRKQELFDHNLLSPKFVKEYYAHFYNSSQIEKEMKYPVNDTSIYSMLSQNPKERKAYESKRNEEYPLILDTQLKAASEAFDVFDDYTEAILVPYERGTSIIEELQSITYGLPSMELIHSAQPYMVNISCNNLQKLKDNRGVYMDERSGIWILDKRFYDDKLGVVIEGGNMELFMIGF